MTSFNDSQIQISIIIPVYNLSGLIAETLDSVLAQTFTNFEVLVIDDASTDNTCEIIKSYQDNDSRIKLLKNMHKKGASGTRNTGIDYAKGEWIAFLDGDDLWSNNSLELRLKALDSYPNAEFISGNYARFDESIDNLYPTHASINERWNKYFGNAVVNKKLVCINNPLEDFIPATLVSTCTVLVKASIIKKLNGFDENILCYEDNQLWLRIAASVKIFVFVPQTIMFYRQREGSITHSNKSIYHYAPQAYRALLHDPLLKDYKKDLLNNICHFIHLNSFFYRNNKQYLQALRWSFQYVLCAPLSKIAWKSLLASCLFR